MFWCLDWRITLAGIRLTRITTTKEQYAGLSAVSGAGWDVLFYGEFTGAAAGYVGTACGCTAVGGAGDASGVAVSYRCVGGFAGLYALRLDIAVRG